MWFKESERLLFAFHSATVDPETLPLSLWLISHLSALYLVTGGCCHCLPPSELPGDYWSSIHFRYKDKGDDALIRSGILWHSTVFLSGMPGYCLTWKGKVRFSQFNFFNAHVVSHSRVLLTSPYNKMLALIQLSVRTKLSYIRLYRYIRERFTAIANLSQQPAFQYTLNSHLLLPHYCTDTYLYYICFHIPIHIYTTVHTVYTWPAVYSYLYNCVYCIYL